MIKYCNATLALAVSILLGLNAVAGANETGTDRKLILPNNDGMGGREGAAKWAEVERNWPIGSIQVARADFFDSSMEKQDRDVRRQLATFVKKHKNSSDIGYPATAKVTNIHDYQIIERDGNAYRVSIRYDVVASVDSATFEDVFVIELGADGSVEVLEMVR